LRWVKGGQLNRCELQDDSFAAVRIYRSRVKEGSPVSVRSDALDLQGPPAQQGIVRAMLGGGIDPEEGSTGTTWRERLEAVYVGQLRAKPAFAQLRFIGMPDGGREVVRVARSAPNSEIHVVPDAELQRKGDRGYFQQLIGLPPGTIYVSLIELNKEHGVTIRISFPSLNCSITTSSICTLANAPDHFPRSD
jgi:hypothetical protein